MGKRVHIIDLESGNLQSLANAIKYVGSYEVVFIHNSDEYAKCEKEIERLMFPGVGNYGHFVKELNLRGLSAPIGQYLKSGRALMGICVGLQTLFADSEESSEPCYKPLELLDLVLTKFDSNDKVFAENNRRKAVPHIGWNTIQNIETEGKKLPEDKSLYGVNTRSKYYFVHSYAAIINSQQKKKAIEEAAKSGWDFAFGKYGSEIFLAAIAKDNFFATQFHPEKSGIAGITVLKDFLEGNKFSLAPEPSTSNSNKIEKTIGGLSRRVIACLDVRTNDDGDLVVTKGDQYNVRETHGGSKVRNLGKPVELATKYYKQGADEVTFLNITSFRNSPLKDLPMLGVLKMAAETIYVPLTVGGGIKDMVDPATGGLVPAVKVADMYFRSGADKVSIGSDAVTIAENYYASNKEKTGKSSIETIAATFGNQAVVISVDPKRKFISSPSETSMKLIKIENPDEFGPNMEQFCYYQVTSQGGRKVHDLGALELCLACEDLGAGEILLNSIDHDGSNKGFNLQLISHIKTEVSIPVIASSGAGNPEHFKQVFELDCGVDAALGAGLFHRGEYEVNDVKSYLQDKAGMDVRLDRTEL